MKHAQEKLKHSNRILIKMNFMRKKDKTVQRSHFKQKKNSAKDLGAMEKKMERFVLRGSSFPRRVFTSQGIIIFQTKGPGADPGNPSFKLIISPFPPFKGSFFPIFTELPSMIYESSAVQ